MNVCGIPGHNHITWCVEPDGHEGCHTFAPKPTPDDLMSDQLEWIVRLLITACPDHYIGDITTPRPKCCPFHHAAKLVQDTQKILREMHQ